MKKLNLFLAALFTATVMNLQAATPDYLYLTSRKADGTGTVRLNKYSSSGAPSSLTATFEYSKDRINWTPYDTWGTFGNPTPRTALGAAIALADGDTIFFRAKGNNGKNATLTSNRFASFRFAFGENDSIAAGGNPMSLYDASCEQDTMTAYGFYGLFFGAAPLVSVSELKLPATQLAEWCYTYLFRGTSVTQSPELKVTTLAPNCYRGMFYACTALTQAPELPADTLAEGCYHSIFSDCTALTSAPELKATTLATDCYTCMFSGCSLTQAPELKVTKLATSCYNSMFSGCKALTQVPELPADTLVAYCYYYMFSSCTALTSAPELKATTLAPSCYESMLQNCTALTQAPELNVTTLAAGCYKNMFQGDTSLIQAPELKATTLADNCYNGMFKNCSKLEVNTFSLICDGAELVVPSVSGDAPTNWNKDMFKNCKGDAVGNIQLGGHYCIREYGMPLPIYGRKVTNGNFGTICLARKFYATEGVDGLFVPYEKNETTLFCEEVELKDVVAGGAYIFKSNADSVTFFMEGEVVSDPVNNDHMRGWLKADFVLTGETDSYMLNNNQIIKPEIGSTILKNRAFIDLEDVPNKAAAPARGRTISFGINGTTGMVDVNATRMSDVHKFVNNGQLIIIREGRKFNAQGQEL